MRTKPKNYNEKFIQYMCKELNYAGLPWMIPDDTQFALSLKRSKEPMGVDFVLFDEYGDYAGFRGNSFDQDYADTYVKYRTTDKGWSGWNYDWHEQTWITD